MAEKPIEPTNADEVTTGMQQLTLDVEAEPLDQNGPEDLSEPEDVAPTIGADEVKDSESLPPETKTEPVKGRVFVGGISWRTTDRDLREYFGEFGAIKDCLVCKDQWTGKSRGFGFLSFEDPEVAKMLISKTHNIGGRTVQVKTAVPKSNNVSHPEAPRIPVGQNRTKLFVGGLHRSVSNKEFRAYFEPYGKLTDAFIMYNMQSRRSRGFGFVTFVSQESAHKCLRERHTIRGKTVELKVAIPREVIGSARDKRKMRSGRPQHHQQHPQQHPQHHVKYEGWPTDLHPNGGAVPYGHLVPATQMMPPPLLSPGSEARGHGMVPQQPMPASTANPHVGVYDQWMPSLMGGRATGGMGAGMYSQDVYYGAMAPPRGLTANPYGYGYHMPMYNPYPDAPVTYDRAAAMYNSGPPVFPIPPPSTAPPSVAVQPANVAPPYPDSMDSAPDTNTANQPPYPDDTS